MQSGPLSNPYAPPAAASFTEGPQGGAIGAYETQRQRVFLLFFLSVVTLGIYSSVWFLLRRRFLDSLDSHLRLGAFAFAPLGATLLSFGVAFVGLPDAVSRLIGYGLSAISIVAAFRVANILRSNFARTGRTLPISGVATFFFNVLYLQYIINRAAETRPLATPAP